ncbi:MAG: hypothetical protein RSB59_02150, partial [Clostridia bacterium]
MIEYNEIRNQLNDDKEELTRSFESINPEKLRARIKELTAVQDGSGFWDNVENAKIVSKEISQLQAKVQRFTKLLAQIDDTLELVDIV